MEQNYVFMTDSDSDLPFHLKEQYDIPVVYMPYALDGKEYFDDLGQMLDHKSYFDMMRNGAAPVTSALNGLGHGGILFQVGGQFLAHQAVHHAADLAGTELGFGLALELRILHLDGDDGRQALADVLALEVRLVVLEDLVPAAVIVDRPGHSGVEALQVGAAVRRGDVVGEGIDVLRVGVVILHGHFDQDAVLDAFGVDRFREQHLLVLVQELDELPQAALAPRTGRFRIRRSSPPAR